MPGIRVKRSILAAWVALTTAIGGCTPATRTPARPPAAIGAAQGSLVQVKVGGVCAVMAITSAPWFREPGTMA